MISAVHAMNSEESISLLLHFSLLISSLRPQSCLLPGHQPRDIDCYSKSLLGKAKC